MTVASRPDNRLWLERIQLTEFRSYASLVLETGPEPQVLLGANGSGKTNLLEAISLLAPGNGLRQTPLRDLARFKGDGTWAIAAHVHSFMGPVAIGTGLRPLRNADDRATRIVRIDHDTKGSPSVLSDYVEIVWLTPAMDGLFTGPASDRRTFLDRIITGLEPGYRPIVNRFEKAMQSRNRLLADGVREDAQLAGFEMAMAESGVAMAAARRLAVKALRKLIAERRDRDPGSPFPWAGVTLQGAIEEALEVEAAVDVEDRYLATLRNARERDRAAGRTLDGPHRSDIAVVHGPKEMPARLSSSGEQKLLLLGLMLSHAELAARHREGTAPLLLLDEVTAHLDAVRRAALFSEIERLGSQAWMTGTDRSAFEWLSGKARFWVVEGGGARAL